MAITYNKLLDICPQMVVDVKDYDKVVIEKQRLKHCLDAVIHFCETEMSWEYFRAEYQLGDNPTKSMQNADKLRKYLESNGWEPKQEGGKDE